MDQSMGLLTPLSFVPHSNLPYTDDMTFSQRVYNTFITSYDSFFRRINYIRGQNNLAKKHFAKVIVGEIPHVSEMEKRISVVLVNSHKAFDKPRPKMPGMIDIGGSQVKSPAVIKNEAISVRDKKCHFVKLLKNIFLEIHKLSSRWRHLLLIRNLLKNRRNSPRKAHRNNRNFQNSETKRVAESESSHSKPSAKRDD